MKAAVKVASTASANAEKELNSFIDKFDPKNQALIRAVRKALRKRLPTANELGYDNYNFFVLGYCATERPSDCIVSIRCKRERSGAVLHPRRWSSRSTQDFARLG